MSTLPTIARLGTMFERTALVRDETDLQEVLEDVCHTIAELLGYRAVVVNVYRPAFDDMLTSAAVGSEDSVKELVGKSSPRETWVPLLDDRFARRGAYFVPGRRVRLGWDGRAQLRAPASRRATTPMPGRPRTRCSCRSATRRAF